MSSACEMLSGWVPADVLVSGLERELRARGATFDDLDERIAAELGVAVDDWLGYLEVRSAADRYQHAAARKKRRDGGERE